MSNQAASQTQSPYWNLPSAQLMQSLDSRLSGLSASQAQQRLAASGPNRLDTREKASPFVLFFNQFKSPIVLILLFATLVSAFVNDWIDSLIILMIVLGSALLSFFQEYSAGNAADQLRARVQSKSRVVRDGQTTDIPSEALVPGDIVLLSAGSLIPADGVILEANDFFVNQAVLTGETFPVEKKPGTVPIDAGLAERTNIVFMGTNVRSGSARVLVIETGRRTSFGQIANSLALRPPETEFERGIRRLGYLLTEVMFLLVIGIFTFNVLFLPFLPLLPVQILLINFLTDLPEMTIASDNVDAVFVERPHRLNVNLVRRFMLVFGPLSSFFDLLTFGVLIWLVKANETSFQTGWFIESVISAGLVVFAVRTQLPFQSSHPSRMMLGMTALVAATVLVMPYSPLAGLLSFTALPVHYLLIIFGIIALYFMAAELTKRWFYRRHTADL